MISRRTVTKLLAALGLSSYLPIPASAQQGTVFPGHTVTLKDQLEKGLRARRSQEFEYVRRVVELVEQRQLPLSLVRTTFLWARDKRPYPFPYFQLALTRRAAALGVDLPHDLRRR